MNEKKSKQSLYQMYDTLWLYNTYTYFVVKLSPPSVALSRLEDRTMTLELNLSCSTRPKVPWLKSVVYQVFYSSDYSNNMVSYIIIPPSNKVFLRGVNVKQNQFGYVLKLYRENSILKRAGEV